MLSFSALLTSDGEEILRWRHVVSNEYVAPDDWDSLLVLLVNLECDFLPSPNLTKGRGFEVLR